MRTNRFFDGLIEKQDDGAVIDHLDLLDKVIGSGMFSEPIHVELNEIDLYKGMQGVLFAAIILRIWKMDEARFPVVV